MENLLDDYNKKRNFEKTPEPKAKIKKPKSKAIINQTDKNAVAKISERIGIITTNTNRKETDPQINEMKTTKKSNLKFVVQHHIARNDHFDFRLEWHGALLSWAVPKGPSFNPKDKRLAIQVENHPLDYRNFEGTIPKGEYGGGTVMLWDEGTWSPLSDVKQMLSDGALKFSLNGKRLQGDWALIKLKNEKKENEGNWILLKENDEFAKKTAGISGFNTSIRTGRTMQEIENNKKKILKNPFQKVTVQLAKAVPKAPENEDWLYEIKYDGYRIVAFVENNEARLVTRNNKDFTHYFKDIATSLISLSNGRPMILDGEIVITNESGISDFQLLQNHLRRSKNKNPAYVVFDLLALDGKDLRKKPLIQRKELLENLLLEAPENISYSKHIIGNGKEIFLNICKLKVEGIVGKKKNSIYSGNRSGSWIKLKCNLRQEFVIGGYTVTGKKPSGVSSLLLGFYEKNKLVFAGRTGTGMTHQTSSEIENMLKKIAQKKCPFVAIPESKKEETITYVKPLYLAEVQFAEWTHENLLRQASFKGIRNDKNPKDVIKETIFDFDEDNSEQQNKTKIKSKTNIRKEKDTSAEMLNDLDKKIQTEFEKKKVVLKKPIIKIPKICLSETKNKDGTISLCDIKISNPNKLMYFNPEIKKIDVVRYYLAVAERMLPYLQNRLISIVRCPKGINEPCFFKKHPIGKNKGIVTVKIKTSTGEKTEFYYIENILGLIFEAQMDTLEFHTWGSKVKTLEKPDIMVFDLDPQEGLELKKIRQGVLDLKSVLDELSLVSFLKTSGGKGYHLVLPFKPSANWEKFYDFSKMIAEVMVQKWPDRYTNNIRKSNRTNKIFIDWVRNGKGATSIAPYSLRAREGASVSMPIFWNELDSITPNSIKLEDALTRLKKPDPWANFFEIVQEIK